MTYTKICKYFTLNSSINFTVNFKFQAFSIPTIPFSLKQYVYCEKSNNLHENPVTINDGVVTRK